VYSQRVLTFPVPGEDTLAPRDVCGGFDFVSDALVTVDVSVLESFAYALSDVESSIEEIESLLQRLAYVICVSVIKTFVRGGRSGLVVLKKVLPNIFRTYCVPSPYDVLVKCGLVPVYPDTLCEYPSFYFQPDLDGIWMIEQDSGKEHGKKRKRPEAPRSDQLQQDYEAVRSGWSSASNS
jgi:hypothetical protein